MADNEYELQPTLTNQNQDYCNDTSGAKNRGIWSKLISEFMKNSTIHGLNHIAENSYRSRRFIWILIVTCGFTLFCFQVTNSVIYFFERPVSVNVKVNYNDTLRFPAVTICNHNDFRISRVAELGWYTKLQSAFKRDQQTKPKTKDKNKLNLPLKEIMLNTSHRKSDLIVSCKWAGSDCLKEDFKLVLSDYGVCFTFNSVQDSNKWVNQQGSSGGLRLKVNIEQYEYMKGPTDGAGIKLLLHSPEEFPLVKYLGQAIAPGSHTLVGISILEVRNLPEPHGKCVNQRKLKYFNQHYSVSVCHAECKQDEVRKICKCQDFYLVSDEYDTLPLCTLQDYLYCVRPLLEVFDNNDRQCDCPTPCHQTIYDPLITAGILSDIDKDKILTGDPLYHDNLKRNFMRARETRQRFEDRIASRDHAIIQDMLKEIARITNLIYHVSKKSQQIEDGLHQIEKQLVPHLNVHRTTMAFAEYVIKHNFVRGYNVKYERYLQHLGFDYIPFTTLVDIALNMTMERRTSISDQIITINVDTKLALLALARRKFNESYEGYKYGFSLSTYKYTLVKEYDAIFSPPCYFNVTQHNGELYSNNFFKKLSLMKDGLDQLKEITIAGTKGDVDIKAWNNARERFINGSKGYNLALFLFKDRIIQMPLAIITENITHFEHDKKSYEVLTNRIRRYLAELKDNLHTFRKQWRNVKKINELALAYLRNDKNITKTILAQYVTDVSVTNTILSLRKLIALILSRDQDISDDLSTLLRKAKSLIAHCSDKCTKPFYERLKRDLNSYHPLNITEGKECLDIERVLKKVLNISKCNLIRRIPIGQVLKSVEMSEIELNRQSTNILHSLMSMRLSEIVGSQGEEFRHKFLEFNQYFLLYLKGNELNTNFIRNNFMNIDIFMRELSYEEIQQQVGYTLTNLLSDIGGSMGLFIGASVITAFEILDALFYNGIVVAKRKQKRKRQDVYFSKI